MHRKRGPRVSLRKQRRAVLRISNSRVEFEIENGEDVGVDKMDSKLQQTPLIEATASAKASERAASEGRLLYRLRPTVRIMQAFGCFPCAFDVELQHTKSTKDKYCDRAISINLMLYSLALLGGNGILFIHNVQAMYMSQEQLGILHAITVSWIITGLKPLVNSFHFALFIFKIRHHRKLLLRLQRVDDQFFVLSGRRVHGVQNANILMMRLMVWSLLFSFFFRIIDIGAQGFEGLLAHWLNAVSPILVPLLTAWNVIPLGYFFILHRIVRQWFNDLSKMLKTDKFLQKHSLSEYFSYYKILIEALQEMRILFNSFIAFSLAWSLLSLCLAIYFVTQAPIFADAPKEMEMTPEDEIAFRIAIAFNLSWSLLQILVAIGFILVISITGIKTNETATWIMTTVLDCDPRNEERCDTATLNKFNLMINTLCNWGITLCRSFPIQRSTLITMVSLIATYSMLLMKLQSSQAKNKEGSNQWINDSDFGVGEVKA